MGNEIFDEIKVNLVNLKMDECLGLIKKGIDEKVAAYDMLMRGLYEGMKIIGQKFEEREYYLAELMFVAKIMTDSIEILEPHMKTALETSGSVLIGTVEGDHHDIGKSIVGTLLTTSGIKVHDLGVDVPIKVWIEKIKEIKPNVVGLSCLMGASMSSMRNVIQELEKQQLRDQVKVVIGGGAVSQIVADQIKADAYAFDAMSALKIIKQFLD